MSDASRFHRTTPGVYWLAAVFAALFSLPGAGLALQNDTVPDSGRNARSEKAIEDKSSPSSQKQAEKTPDRTRSKPIDEQQLEYAKVERLTDAIDVLKRGLEKRGMSDYSGLITEDSVKRAVRTSINGVRVDYARAMASAKDDKARQTVEREVARFLTVIKPLYDEILKSGKWPRGAFFHHGPKSPHGFWLNLFVDTRDDDDFELRPGQSIGYALQILKVEHGFSGPSDAVLRRGQRSEKDAEKETPAKPTAEREAAQHQNGREESSKKEARKERGGTQRKPQTKNQDSGAGNATTSDERAATPALTFTGTVIERTTKKPIEGARVTITRYAPKGTGHEVLGTSEHRTDSEGRYEFTLGSDLKGHDRFLIREKVTHDRYVWISGGSFGVNMAEEAKRPRGIRQLQPMEVAAAETIRGGIETPEGKPAPGVPLVVKSLTAAGHPELPEGISSRVDVETDAQGRFSAAVIKEASAAVTIESPNHAPRVVMVGQKRGDLGRIRLAQGISLTGTVVDPEGRPIEGVWVNAFSVPDEPSFMWLEDSGEFRQGGYFAEQVTRADRTDEQGQFELKGLGPGKYTVMVMDRTEDFRHPAGESKPLPAAFLKRELTLKEGQGQQTIELRALPSLTIEVAFVDSAGKPVEAQEGMVISGTYQGQDFGVFLRKTSPDKIVAKVPQGIRDVTLPLHMTGVRYRVSKDQPLRADAEIKLGTPTADIRDIQIVKYNEPRLFVKAVDQAGQPVKDFKPKIEYPPGVKEPLPPGAHFATGVVGDVFLRPLPDGRWRTGGLLPQQEFMVTAEAEGYQPASQQLKLAEGESKEVTLRLTKR